MTGLGLADYVAVIFYNIIARMNRPNVILNDIAHGLLGASMRQQ
jgi:hypothetical protein